MAKKRPKWSTNVAKAMTKVYVCPDPCPMKYSGTKRDTEGNILHSMDCHASCPLNNKGIR